jgi:hypothetical protein
MKNKSIIVFVTLILFTACSNTKNLVKKDVRVNKVPVPSRTCRGGYYNNRRD